MSAAVIVSSKMSAEVMESSSISELATPPTAMFPATITSVPISTDAMELSTIETEFTEAVPIKPSLVIVNKFAVLAVLVTLMISAVGLVSVPLLTSKETASEPLATSRPPEKVP